MALTPTFQSILAQAKRSEPEALKCIYITYHPIISRYVSRYAHPQVVEDITSDVFLEMLNAIHTLQANDEAAFRAWLFWIACTAIAAYHRRADREKVRVVPLEIASNISSPDDPTMPLLQAEKLTALTGAISMLTTKRRKIVIGRVVQDQPARALAQQIGKSEASIYKIQSRALQDLRKNKALRRETMHFIIVFLVSITVISVCVAIGRAQPGSPFYPVKQLITGTDDTGSDNSSRHNIPRRPTVEATATATVAPTPTPSPTPSPTAKKAPRATPTPSDGLLDAASTALPLSSASTPVACVMGTCLGNPLP